jgi:hypothetical protein
MPINAPSGTDQIFALISIPIQAELIEGSPANRSGRRVPTAPVSTGRAGCWRFAVNCAAMDRSRERLPHHRGLRALLPALAHIVGDRWPPTSAQEIEGPMAVKCRLM